jgi:hypothetical protein
VIIISTLTIPTLMDLGLVGQKLKTVFNYGKFKFLKREKMTAQATGS